MYFQKLVFFTTNDLSQKLIERSLALILCVSTRISVKSDFSQQMNILFASLSFLPAADPDEQIAITKGDEKSNQST